MTERKLRVLYVAEAFGGGLFEIIKIKAEGLVERRHEAAIAYGIRPETPGNVRSEMHSAVELFPMPWTERTLGAQVAAIRALRRLVRQWRPDVVHLMSSYAGVHGAIALSGRVPLLYTAQGYAFTMSSIAPRKRLAYLLLEDLVARRVDVVAGCSISEGEQARALPGVKAVAVVENGIPELDMPDVATDIQSGVDVPRVVALGRPSPQRRPEACAKILSALHNDADVRWIGGGAPSSGTKALEAAGIPMTGWLSRDATLAELTQASVYLHWTGWDGLPLSVLEALAHDVVVVASDIGPNREVLGPEQTVRTEHEAVQLIRAILGEPGLREHLLESQRRRRVLYSAKRMIDGWIRLYESLADQLA